MGIYIITEIMELKNGGSVILSNHIKETDVACGIFEARSYMLLQSVDTEKVIKQQYNSEEGWGFTKVELKDGSTIEIAMSLLTLM